MSRRTYRQTRRAEKTAERRAELLETARRLVIEEGFHGVGLEAVARAAGVTRRTIYNLFGSKLGLLNALFDAVAERGQVWRLMEAGNLSDGRAAVLHLVEASCRLWASDRDLLRRLVGLAAVDPETAVVTAEREKRRERTWFHVVERLAAEGRLRPGIDVPDAVRVLMLLTSFSSYDVLAPPAADPAAAVPLLTRLVGAVVDLDAGGAELPPDG